MRRNLRIVKLTPIALSFCESCKAEFKSTQRIENDAETEMKKAFETHTCNRDAFPCSIIGVFALPSKLLPPRIVPAKTKESAAPFWQCAGRKTPLHNQLEFFAGVVPS